MALSHAAYLSDQPTRAAIWCDRSAGGSRRCIPLQFLMQWDDEGMERQPTLDLFDAFGAKEKTLHADLGGHAGVPWFEVDAAAQFFTRHLS